MSKGLKNAEQKTMRFNIESIFKFNPERVYLMKIVDIKIAKDIISSGDDGVIENVYYEFW